jgi:hypothetical protein
MPIVGAVQRKDNFVTRSLTPIPNTMIRMTTGKSERTDLGMGMSPEVAEEVFRWANWILIGALVVGVLATYAIVVSGNVKEANLKRELAHRTSAQPKLIWRV